MTERIPRSHPTHTVQWCIACLLALLPVSGFSSAHQLRPGEVPPDGLGSYPGERVKLSDYRGKVVIVTFWASWCTPCRQELPILGGIQESATSANLQVLAVNYGESNAQFKEIVRVLKPALKDAPMKLLSDQYGYYANQYGVKGIPHMVIIGRDGRIAAVFRGYNASALPRLVKEINKLLVEPAQPVPQAPEETHWSER